MRLPLPWYSTSGDATEETVVKGEMGGIDSPATVSAETLNENDDCCDIESTMPAIFLSPGRHSASRCVSPLSFFLGGGGGGSGDHSPPTWCSPSRIVIPALLSPIRDGIEGSTNMHGVGNGGSDMFLKAIPLDLSFDSAQGMETVGWGISERQLKERPAFISATVFDAGLDTRGVGLSIKRIQERFVVAAIRGDGLFSSKPFAALPSFNSISINRFSISPPF